ncbi:probable glutathione S-transferase [Punica granatum]|uniref:Glutathione S-transferase n=2 Tax=Punica granatum TaxID=22663 RepID=A0A2I0LAV3_PUNGR|nr:probable glutathione S-transferase [Punica granatum]PKI77801.1 hypothetical protein CRG98_001765 [Punica granatum]
MAGDHCRHHPQVKILGSKASIFCMRVEWALKLKGVEYEYTEENLMNKSELLLKSNPVHKKVPVLLHGETAVSESLVILECIDETWSEEACPRLLPIEPYERAQARFWAKFLDEKVIFGTWDACKAEGEEKEKAIEVALKSLALVEEHIMGKKFFGGEQIGYLDLVAGWLPLWLGVMEEVGGMKLLHPGQFPSLHEWTRKFADVTVIKESLPPREEIVNHLSGGLRYLRSLAANKP